jgi:hypothetical protein
MEFHSNTHPKLITDRISNMYDLTKASVQNGCVHNLFQIYIRPNLSILVVIFAIAICLAWCYHNTHKEGYGRIARPTFNPNQPMEGQTSYVHYLPDDLAPRQRKPKNYPAPPNDVNDFQYTGPYYRNNRDLSDDANVEFVQANQDNLATFNEYLE